MKEGPTQENLARRLAAAASSLQSVVLNLPPSNTSFWQVEKAGRNEEMTVKRLTEQESQNLGSVAHPSFVALEDNALD